MANKFLIPFLLVLIFSLIYNYLKIDQRMGFLKNENGFYSMGAIASITGIIFCVVVYRINSVNKIIDKNK